MSRQLPEGLLMLNVEPAPSTVIVLAHQMLAVPLVMLTVPPLVTFMTPPGP